MSRKTTYKRWPSWLLMAMIVAGLLAVGVSRAGEPRTADQRVQAIAKRLACPVCNGESVADSRATSANQIRTNIEALVAEGRLDDDAIVAEVDANYEDDLSLVPAGSGLDALAWILPVVAAVGGVGGLVAAFARWRRRPDPTGPSAADRELVEAALRAPSDP